MSSLWAQVATTSDEGRPRAYDMPPLQVPLLEQAEEGEEKVSVTYSKARTRLNPFSEPMKAWWVERYVVLHYAGEISVNKNKKPSERSVFSPTPNSLAGKALTARNPNYFTHPAFKDLDALEAKYRDSTLSKSERGKVVEALWPLVDRLLRERRINGELGTPPMEAGGSLQEIRDNLVELRTNLNTLRFDLNVLRVEAKRKGWDI